MSNFSLQQQSHVRRLIEKLVNETASDAEFAELQQVLTENRNARSLYIEYMSVHANLRKMYLIDEDDVARHSGAEFGGSEVEDDARSSLLNANDDGRTVARSFAVSRMAKWAVAAVVVAGLLAIVMVKTASRNGGAHVGAVVSSPEAPSTADKAVAILSRAAEVVWKSEPHSVGSLLETGVLEIHSGVVQIQFYCGASLILEGPVRFELFDANHGFLHHGRLRAYVPARARGFVVGSPDCEVEDLGTEFAMEVGAENSEVHVLDGEVRITDSDGDEPELLTTGKAVQRDSTGVRREFSADKERFMGPQELVEQVLAMEIHGFEDWVKFIDTVRMDPDCLALYSFQESHAWGRTLVNSAMESSGSSNGAIVGCDWTAGRWHGDKRALQFSNASHRVRVNIPGLFDDISLCTWVRVDDLQHKPMAIMHPETDQPNFLHWSIDGGLLHFSVTDHVDGVPRRIHYSSRQTAVFPRDFGEWIHLAVVYDADEQRVTHFCNGQVISRVEVTIPQKVGIGIADFGNWPYKEWAKGTKFEIRNLSGAMDEFMAFRRALAPDYIRMIYEAGRP